MFILTDFSFLDGFVGSTACLSFLFLCWASLSLNYRERRAERLKINNLTRSRLRHVQTFTHQQLTPRLVFQPFDYTTTYIQTNSLPTICTLNHFNGTTILTLSTRNLYQQSTLTISPSHKSDSKPAKTRRNPDVS